MDWEGAGIRGQAPGRGAGSWGASGGRVTRRVKRAFQLRGGIATLEWPIVSGHEQYQ